MTTRRSKTRVSGAYHTACTKLLAKDRDRLRYLAELQHISVYELTRRILISYCRVQAPTLPEPSRSDSQRPSR